MGEPCHSRTGSLLDEVSFVQVVLVMGDRFPFLSGSQPGATCVSPFSSMTIVPHLFASRLRPRDPWAALCDLGAG